MEVHVAVHRARQRDKAFRLYDLRALWWIEPPDGSDFSVADGNCLLSCPVRQRAERAPDEHRFVLHERSPSSVQI